MNPYAMLGSGTDAPEANALAGRLVAWHDSMVAHERRLAGIRTADLCHDDCPHARAHILWNEAVVILGERAKQLVFLRSRATARRNSTVLVS